jgi:nitrile hydratase accessory protein
MPESLPSLEALPALPRDQEGPVFNAPWEAQAFALAVSLSEAGHFTWSEWVQVFSRQIQLAQEQGEPDLGNTYYQHWLAALDISFAFFTHVGCSTDESATATSTPVR